MWKPLTDFDEEVKVGDKLSSHDSTTFGAKGIVTAIGKYQILLIDEHDKGVEIQFSKKYWQVWREPVLWFPSTGEINWFVSPRIDPTFDSFHYNNENMTRYEAGNLFRTREQAQQAQQAADEIKKVLVKIHEDLGE